jgi:hypothetical protein
MLVIAQHFIQNPDVFWDKAREVTSSLPSELKIHSVFPSTDLKTGTCVWEAPSVEDVQQFLDNEVGNVSRNVCYEIKEEMAIGLPQKSREEAFPA